MKKILGLSAALLLLTGVCHAQWSAQDSIRLQEMLNGNKELKINPKAVNQIDFGNGGVINVAPKMAEEKRWLLPDETVAGVLPKNKPSLSPDGLSPDKLRNKFAFDVVKQLGDPLQLGKWGVTVNGGAVGGLDLMAVFTKDFWDKSGEKRRLRTLEVLRTYGDSTTAFINFPIEPIVR